MVMVKRKRGHGSRCLRLALPALALLLCAAGIGQAAGHCVCEPQDCREAHTVDDLVALSTALTRVTCISTNGLRPALDGGLSSNIGQLTALTWLHVEGARFEGPIPVEMGLLQDLEFLSLPDNGLNGPIPAELGGLRKLTSMNLNRNMLTSSVPAALGELSQLENLELFDNELTGSLPAALGDLAQLTSFWLNENKISGAIPSRLASLGNLVNFVLADNQMTGTVPDFASAKLKSLYVISPRVCGDAPAFSAVHTDLPDDGGLIVECGSWSTQSPTAAPTPTDNPTKSPVEPQVVSKAPSTSSPTPSSATDLAPQHAVTLGMLLVALHCLY